MTQGRLALLMAVLLSLGLTGCAKRAPPPPAERSSPFESLSFRGFHKVYPSGLQLLVYEDPKAPQVTLGVSYLAGAADDPPGKEGLALVTGYLTYGLQPGGPQKPGLSLQLASTGAHLHPSITHDDTTYEVTAPAGQLPRLMALEAARMQAPLSHLTEEGLDAVRTGLMTLHQEQVRHLPALGEVDRAFESLLPGHPYGHGVRGTPESIRRITLEDVRAFVKAHYTPDRAVVVVTGPVRAEDVQFELARGFAGLTGTGSASSASAAQQRLVPLPGLGDPGGVGSITQGPVNEPALWMAWVLPGLQAGKRLVAAQLQYLLQDSLTRALRGDRRVQGTWVRAWERQGMTLLTVRIGLSHKDDAGGVTTTVLGLLDRVQQDAQRVSLHPNRRVLFEPHRMMLYRSLEQRSSADIARVFRATGKPNYIRFWQQGISTSLDDLPSYCREYLRPEQTRTVLVLPDERGATLSSTSAKELDAAARMEAFPWGETVPALGKAPRPPVLDALGETERFQLSNGLTVVTVRRGSSPLVEARLLTRLYPSDSISHSQVSRLSAFLSVSLWEESPLVAKTGIAFQPSAGHFGLQSTGLVELLPARLALLRTTVEQLTWADEASFNRERDKAHQRFLESGTKGMDTTRLTLALVSPESTEPRSRQFPEDLKALQWEQARDWRTEQFHAGNATLLLVGGLPPSPELRQHIESVFGSWRGHKGGNTPQRASPPARPSKRTLVVMDMPGRDVATILLALRWPKLDVRQQAAADVLALVLEEQLKKERIPQQLLAPAPRVSMAGNQLMLATSVEADKTSALLDQVLSHMAALESAAPPSELVEQVRWRLARNHAAGFRTSAQVMEQLDKLTRQEQPLEYAFQYSRHLAGMTPEQLQDLMGQSSLGSEIIAIRGDMATLKPQFEKAGYDVEVKDSSDSSRSGTSVHGVESGDESGT